MSNASMKQIEECFVKFFLSQAAEIEPQTIQALIDNGYRNKVSLLCFDLLHDLSQLNDVPLAQRSILRKYIGALQEFCPFNVTIDQNALSRHVDAKPNKKRKIDDADDDDDYYGGYSANPFSGHFSFNRTFGDISPSIGSNSSSLAKSPPNHLIGKYQKIATTAATSPVTSRGGGSSSKRTIRKQSDEDANEDGGDHVQDYEMAEQNTTKSMNTTARTSRGGRKAREPIPRTKSQIRFHAEKERQNMSLNIKDDDDEESEPISSPVSEVTPKSRRRTVTTSRANSSIIATTSPVNERHVPTPAEMAIRAKIEEKKKAKEEAKKTITTTKRRIRRT